MGFIIEDIEDTEENSPGRWALPGEALALASEIDARRRDREFSQLPYEEYLRTPHWTEVRERALARAGHQCKRCEARWGLQVHHLTYTRLGNEADRDLMVLCRACHAIEHGL